MPWKLELHQLIRTYYIPIDPDLTKSRKLCSFGSWNRVRISSRTGAPIRGICAACPCPSAGPVAAKHPVMELPSTRFPFMPIAKIAISIQGECVKVSRKQKPETRNFSNSWEFRGSLPSECGRSQTQTQVPARLLTQPFL